MHGLYDGLYDGLYGLYDGWKVFALPPGKEVLWVCNSLPLLFLFPPAGAMCSPNRGLVPLGGATANAVESPTSKPSPSEFVVPVVVPGA